MAGAKNDSTETILRELADGRREHNDLLRAVLVKQQNGSKLPTVVSVSSLTLSVLIALAGLGGFIRTSSSDDVKEKAELSQRVMVLQERVDSVQKLIDIQTRIEKLQKFLEDELIPQAPRRKKISTAPEAQGFADSPRAGLSPPPPLTHRN